MAYAWDLTLATGNAAVDAEHKQMISKFNALIGALGNGADNETTKQAFEDLVRTAAEHFRHEEVLFASLVCPEKEANLRAHAAFRASLCELTRRFVEEGPNTPLLLDVKSRLAEWYINHIKCLDTRLGYLAKAA